MLSMEKTGQLLREYDKLYHNNLNEDEYTFYKFDLGCKVVNTARETSELLEVFVIC